MRFAFLTQGNLFPCAQVVCDRGVCLCVNVCVFVSMCVSCMYIFRGSPEKNEDVATHAPLNKLSQFVNCTSIARS